MAESLYNNNIVLPSLSWVIDLALENLQQRLALLIINHLMTQNIETA